MKEIFRLFSPYVRNEIEQAIRDDENKLEEIRLRIDKPIELNFFNHSILLKQAVFTLDEKLFFVRQLSNHSLYRMEEQFKNGFITLVGGHRIGFAGEMIMYENKPKLNELTFFNIRIARAVEHIATTVIPYLQQGDTYQSTLIYGAPQTGKTTMLRDIAIKLSNNALKVAIVDERSEIAACKNGIPQLNIGNRTDVMDNCPKQIGMMMMIRSMSPQVLLVDEIGNDGDVQAILEAIRTGVTIICSAHSSNIDELQSRPQIKQLIDAKVFKRYIHINRHLNGDFFVQILDGEYRQLHKQKVMKR